VVAGLIDGKVRCLILWERGEVYSLFPHFFVNWRWQMAKYEFEDRWLKENPKALNSGEPIEVNIRDNDTLSWVKVTAMLFDTPQQGAEAVNLINRAGVVTKTIYAKIVGDADDEELSGFNIPGQAL
jgi:hypothetical protein